MMSLLFFVAVLVSLVGYFIALQGLQVSWKRTLPNSYKLVFCVVWGIEAIYDFPILLMARAENDNNLIVILTIVLIVMMLCKLLFVPAMIQKRDEAQSEISFKNALLYGFASKEQKKYRKLTSKEFADQNHIDYIPMVTGNMIERNDVERFIAIENKYIKLYPFNDGDKYSHKKEWFGRFERNGEVYYAKIMDTKKAFNNITNLKEILMQMIQIYFDNMAKDIFIDPYEFALMLEDQPKEEYRGRAKLVITADTLKNRIIEVDEKENAKKYYINRFLDCFLGWNFGKIINNDVELQLRINQLNDYAILKGMRSSFQTYGINLVFNEDVQEYKLKS